MKRKIKRKAIEVLFVLSFILTGCGIDSIFVSKRDAITWAISVAVLIMCAVSIGGDWE